MDIKNFTKNDLLDSLNWGRSSATTNSNDILSALGIFGAGMMLGAGLGVLLAPRAGAETREQIASKASETREQIASKASEVSSTVVNRLPFDSSQDTRSDENALQS